MVHTGTIHLNITAQSGPGNLPGNLRCGVANLLNSGNTGGLANLLNNLLGLWEQRFMTEWVPPVSVCYRTTEAPPQAAPQSYTDCLLAVNAGCRADHAGPGG